MVRVKPAQDETPNGPHVVLDAQWYAALARTLRKGCSLIGLAYDDEVRTEPFASLLPDEARAAAARAARRDAGGAG